MYQQWIRITTKAFPTQQKDIRQQIWWRLMWSPDCGIHPCTDVFRWYLPALSPSRVDMNRWASWCLEGALRDFSKEVLGKWKTTWIVLTNEGGESRAHTFGWDSGKQSGWVIVTAKPPGHQQQEVAAKDHGRVRWECTHPHPSTSASYVSPCLALKTFCAIYGTASGACNATDPTLKSLNWVGIHTVHSYPRQGTGTLRSIPWWIATGWDFYAIDTSMTGCWLVNLCLDETS